MSKKNVFNLTNTLVFCLIFCSCISKPKVQRTDNEVREILKSIIIEKIPYGYFYKRSDYVKYKMDSNSRGLLLKHSTFYLDFLNEQNIWLSMDSLSFFCIDKIRFDSILISGMKYTVAQMEKYDIVKVSKDSDNFVRIDMDKTGYFVFYQDSMQIGRKIHKEYFKRLFDNWWVYKDTYNN